MVCRTIGCLLVLWVLAAVTVEGAEDPQNPPATGHPNHGQEWSGPHCGLNCLYTLLKLEGRDVKFRDLLRPEYLSSARGSSLAQLIAAAEDYGMHAVVINRLTSRALRDSPYPVILHTKTQLTSSQYDHFELFMGDEGGQAKIFDPPRPMRLVPYRELVPRWDGAAVVISSTPIDLRPMFSRSRRSLLLYCVVAILAVILAHALRSAWIIHFKHLTRSLRFGISVIQCGALIVSALVSGFVFHFASDEGFLAYANATESIRVAHAQDFIPKVSIRELGKLMDIQAVIIDARLPGPYQSGHIPGAINLPVNSTEEELAMIMAGIDKLTKVIVYCQSTTCPYDGQIASVLIARGFSDISIFKGGWAEWSSAHGS